MDAIEQTKLVISELQKIPMISENVQQIKELVRYLRFPIVGSVASKGFTIVRARRGDGYRTQTEVSYKTASLCKTAQRASLPNQTIFYGVLSDAILRQELVFDIKNKVCTPINKTTDAELCSILNINEIAELKLIN